MANFLSRRVLLTLGLGRYATWRSICCRFWLDSLMSIKRRFDVLMSIKRRLDVLLMLSDNVWNYGLEWLWSRGASPPQKWPTSCLLFTGTPKSATSRSTPEWCGNEKSCEAPKIARMTLWARATLRFWRSPPPTPFTREWFWRFTPFLELFVLLELQRLSYQNARNKTPKI